jgi:hypothetical protein
MPAFYSAFCIFGVSLDVAELLDILCDASTLDTMLHSVKASSS